jgi:hypothetical protein
MFFTLQVFDFPIVIHQLLFCYEATLREGLSRHPFALAKDIGESPTLQHSGGGTPKKKKIKEITNIFVFNILTII